MKKSHIIALCFDKLFYGHLYKKYNAGIIFSNYGS